MKSLFNRFCFWSVLLIGSGLFLTSCGNGELTKGSAEDALEEAVLKLQDNSQYITLPTGYFEVDKKDIETLKSLADAGLITYKPETIVRTVKSYYYTRNYDHNFATVSLTPEGQKYVIEPVMEIEDEDMINPKAGKESKTEKLLKETNAANSVRITDSIAAAEAATTEAVMEENDVPQPDVNDVSPYEAAKQKSHVTTVYVLSHKNKILKVRNIYCPEDMLKAGKASCDYIYENYKVTPFGEIINGMKEGDRHAASANFIKYVDRGWCVD